ncbi:hypothetical protein FALBO_1411 [Fusarium albosuccineum]|uniref:Uncharacterized protein n=1 Tax=Fusarium albosuccineum TaxID=1237068 RepID=A0A8H4LPZ2_9HYPO|nr:hypothetical protein FALBO_1411 [Fusarium albosuccineum]
MLSATQWNDALFLSFHDQPPTAGTDAPTPGQPRLQDPEAPLGAAADGSAFAAAPSDAYLAIITSPIRRVPKPLLEGGIPEVAEAIAALVLAWLDYDNHVISVMSFLPNQHNTTPLSFYLHFPLKLLSPSIQSVISNNATPS